MRDAFVRPGRFVDSTPALVYRMHEGTLNRH